MKFLSNSIHFLLTLGLLIAFARPLLGEEPQRKLTEVATVPFGSSLRQTVQLLNGYALKKELKMNVPTTLQKGNQLVVSGGEFAGLDVQLWFFSFARDKLHYVTIGFESKDVFATLDTVSALIAKKYGPATTATREYSFPYNVPFRNLDDAAVKEAFKKKKADFHSTWKLSNGVIRCEVEFVEDTGLVTTVRYQHSEFSKEAEEDAKSDL